MLMELSPWQLLILAAIVGAAWASSLFDWGFVTGRDAFWQFPHGTVPGGEYDTAAPFAAYLYYVQSPWQLPLFYVPSIGWPDGANILFADLVPIVAVIGKLIYSLTGAVVNLYGPYFFLCFVLSGVMMVLVLLAAEIRYALAAIIAATFAGTAPILLWRWGHVALMAQFLLIGALALYLFSLRRRAWRGLATTWIGYLIVVYLTNFYLFAMVSIVWICALIQRRINRLSTTQQALTTASLTIMLVTVVVALGGQFSSGTPLPFSHFYGHFSLNLLSPFVPQSSGLLPWLGNIADATGGQFEGYSYFGLGLLLASLLALPAQIGWLRRNLPRHAALAVAFVAVTAFALSHHVYAGSWLLVEVPLPWRVLRVLDTFRSSGRFFWLIYYAQIAVVIILLFRRARPSTILCLTSLMIMQVFDVQPLRRQLIASIAEGPGSAQINPDRLARLVAGAHRVDIVPSFECIRSESEKEREKLARANIELMLAAARMNRPTNTVDLSRITHNVTWLDLLREPSRGRDEWLARQNDEYCKQEIAKVRTNMRPGDIVVLLSDPPRSDELGPRVTCSMLSWARYCQTTDRVDG